MGTQYLASCVGILYIQVQIQILPANRSTNTAGKSKYKYYRQIEIQTLPANRNTNTAGKSKYKYCRQTQIQILPKNRNTNTNGKSKYHIKLYQHIEWSPPMEL